MTPILFIIAGFLAYLAIGLVLLRVLGFNRGAARPAESENNKPEAIDNEETK